MAGALSDAFWQDEQDSYPFTIAFVLKQDMLEAATLLKYARREFNAL